MIPTSEEKKKLSQCWYIGRNFQNRAQNIFTKAKLIQDEEVDKEQYWKLINDDLESLKKVFKESDECTDLEPLKHRINDLIKSVESKDLTKTKENALLIKMF